VSLSRNGDASRKARALGIDIGMPQVEIKGVVGWQHNAMYRLRFAEMTATIVLSGVDNKKPAE